MIKFNLFAIRLLYSIEYDICYLIFLENKQIKIELWETQPEHLTFSQPLSFFIISLRTMTFHDIRLGGGSNNSKTCSRRLCKIEGRNQHIWKKRKRSSHDKCIQPTNTYETQILRLNVENERCLEKDHFMFFGFQCSLQIFHTHERANTTFKMPHHCKMYKVRFHSFPNTR